MRTMCKKVVSRVDILGPVKSFFTKRGSNTCSQCLNSFIIWLLWHCLDSYHQAKLVFLCLQSLILCSLSLYFTRFSNIHNYSTRQSMRLSLQNVKQNFGKRTFLITGANFFYNCPVNVVKSEYIQAFCCCKIMKL